MKNEYRANRKFERSTNQIPGTRFPDETFRDKSGDIEKRFEPEINPEDAEIIGTINYHENGEISTERSIGKNSDPETVRIYAGEAETIIGQKTISFPEILKTNDEELSGLQLGFYKNINDGNQYFLLGLAGQMTGQESQDLIYTGTAIYKPTNKEIATYLDKSQAKLIADGKINSLEDLVLQKTNTQNKEDTSTEIQPGKKAYNNLIIENKEEFLDNYSPLF